MRRAIVGGLACGLALLGFGGQAQGADTIGSDLSGAADTSFSCWEPTTCTNLDLSVQSDSLAPYDGVLVRWRVKSDGAGNSPITLQVVSWPDSTISAVAASRPEQVADGINTFPTRLPIASGQHIAVECCEAPGERIFSSGLLGQAFGSQSPALVVGAPPIGAGALLMTNELLLNADIEPDADRDGYGDETQDACPSNAITQAACPPRPETSITSSPKKTVRTKGRKARVTFAFASSEVNATFRCAMDGSAATTCSSPFRTKVRRGKHRFEVVADAAGFTDETPAVFNFRVKRKRVSPLPNS